MGAVGWIGVGEAEDVPAFVDQLVLAGAVTLEAIGLGMPGETVDFYDDPAFDMNAIPNPDEDPTARVDCDVEVPSRHLLAFE